ncbi:MAG: processing peptidase [Chlorobi bacterium OLB5]|nr:MAG: processing peptidase [Chlorobi bacterium OLB5]
MKKFLNSIFSIIILLTMSVLSYGQNNNFAQIDFKEYDLKNGLHVILYKDNTNPIVSVNIWYHVGAKDEDSGRTGFAHLFEHMMFQGSANIGKTEHFNYIQKAGGTLNGTTNQDRTNYFASVPSNQLELLLWLESDRMSTLQVTQENFDNQREVVKEEKRQRYDNAPYGSRWEEMMKRLFREQTYEWTPIGSMDDLNSADLDYAKNFYKKYYSPDNAVLVVSGDFEYETAEKLIKKYFDDLKPAGTVKNKYEEIIFNQGEINDTIYDNVQLPAVYIGYKIPGTTHNDIYAITLLTMVLGDGKSSRIYNDIVYNKKSARSAGSFLWDNEIGGMLIVTASAFKNTDPVNLLNDITANIQKISDEGITEKELEKAKNSIEHDYVNMMQSTLRIADELANYYTFFKNTGLINTALNEYMKITAEDVRNAAKKYLVNENRVVLTYLPKPGNNK